MTLYSPTEHRLFPSRLGPVYTFTGSSLTTLRAIRNHRSHHGRRRSWTIKDSIIYSLALTFKATRPSSSFGLHLQTGRARYN